MLEVEQHRQTRLYARALGWHYPSRLLDRPRLMLCRSRNLRGGHLLMSVFMISFFPQVSHRDRESALAQIVVVSHFLRAGTTVTRIDSDQLHHTYFYIHSECSYARKEQNVFGEEGRGRESGSNRHAHEFGM